MEPTHSTTHYLWIAAYEAAVFETDNALDARPNSRSVGGY